MRKMTNDEFRQKLASINPRVEPLEPYINSGTKILVKCLKCANEWKVAPNSLLSGHGCPKCAGNIRKTDDEFRSQLSAVNSQIEPLDSYVSANSKIKVKCKQCQNVWEAKPSTLLFGHGCPRCSHGSSLKSNEQFVAEVKRKYPNLKIFSVYKSANEPVNVECGECGYRWSTKAVSLVAAKSAGCPQCSRKKLSQRMTWSENEFKARLATVNPCISLVGSYINSSTKAIFKCEICSNQWEAKPNNVLNGHGCPTCNETGTSYMEQFILEAFKEAFPHYEVISRCRSVIDGELDVYVPALNFAIEPGSWYWHKNGLAKDRKKRELCKKSGIRIITIYDLFPSNTEAPFEEDFIATAHYLGPQADELVDVTKQVLEIAGFRGELDWSLIGAKAYESSKSTRQRLSEELAEVARSNNLVLLSDYRGTREKIQVQCGLCGHIWWANPSDIKAGHGCPKCRYKTSSRAVKCVETGAEYPSCSEAARAIGGSASAIASAARKGHCSGGFHWESVEG